MKDVTRSTKGFTLIELMVVILILAILAALIVPQVMHRQVDAKIAAAKTDESTLESAVRQFRLDCDRLPTTEEGLQSLVAAPSGLESKAKEPYVTKTPLPNDPWGNAYIYQAPGPSGGPESFTIGSNGPTGQPGGTGENSPIVTNNS